MHVQASRRLALVSALLASLAVASCGGGDPDAGLWLGTRDGTRDVTTIVLADGTYYMKYAGPAPGVPGGVVRGTGSFHGTTFTSTDAIDYQYFARPAPATVTAKLGVNKTPTLTLTGSVDTTVAPGTVRSSPLALAFERPFDPDGKLKDLAGSYPGEVNFALGVRQTTFEVTRDGKLQTVLNGCTITGQAVPRQDDAFDLTLQFGASPCVFPGAVFQGAVVYSHDLQQLDAAVVNSTLGLAITFTANKGQ